MKKNYEKPQMKAVKINHRANLLCGSPVSSVDGDVFRGKITGSSGPSRSREADWDDEDW